jgi:hypothetical protein
MQQREDDSSGKTLGVVLIVGWLIVAPFLIGWLGLSGSAASVFAGAPFLLVFVAIGFFSLLAWVLQKLHL